MMLYSCKDADRAFGAGSLLARLASGFIHKLGVCTEHGEYGRPTYREYLEQQERARYEARRAALRGRP